MPIPPDSRKKSKPAPDGPARFRSNLLGWYDRHARVLPWRSKGGERPNPYHVWLSEVMLQQTTVQAVIPYFVKFVDKWPSIAALAAARDEELMREWAGLGYYARARNLLKCARAVVSDHNGCFPDRLEALKALPGIGDYTAAAISSIAFNQVATVIDGNVDRVVSRWFAIETPLPDSKPEIRALAAGLFDWPGAERPGDFAQAMMDLGATICTPKSPKCGVCPVSLNCRAKLAGLAEELPRRKAKAARPRRAGYIYWITRENGDVLFETRLAKGLLGGMTGLPTSDWVAWEAGEKAFPAISHISAMKAGQTEIPGGTLKIRHVFTHFELELRGVMISVTGQELQTGAGQFWVPSHKIEDLGLPSVFKKFTRLMQK